MLVLGDVIPIRTWFLVAVLLAASVVHAQLQSVSATPNAPVAITGDVSCSEKFASGEVKFTNTSSPGNGGARGCRQGEVFRRS